jgi:hypothetical protein
MKSRKKDCALRRASIFLNSDFVDSGFYLGFGAMSAFVRPRAHLMASKYMV